MHLTIVLSWKHQVALSQKITVATLACSSAQVRGRDIGLCTVQTCRRIKFVQQLSLEKMGGRVMTAVYRQSSHCLTAAWNTGSIRRCCSILPICLPVRLPPTAKLCSAGTGLWYLCIIVLQACDDDLPLLFIKVIWQLNVCLVEQ